MQQSRIAFFCTVLCGICGAIALSVHTLNTLQAKEAQKQDQARSIREQSDRSRALVIVAKDFRRMSCWTADGNFTIGRVIPPNDKGGYPPTSCLRRNDGRQYAYIARKNGVMQMIWVFTLVELENQLSQL